MVDFAEALASARAVVAYLEAQEKPPLIVSLPETGLQEPDAFWDYIRGDAGELFPSITQPQVDGINMTLLVGAGKLPLSWMACVLGTEYHETAKTMQGVREGLSVSDAWRKKNLRYYPWYGRGKVQLTWERNYRLATEKLRALGFDVDLIANPDQALDLKIASVIIVQGMLEGWFTGKKLGDYINNAGTREQFVNSRRIVNPGDRPDLIAGYCLEFKKALELGEWK